MNTLKLKPTHKIVNDYFKEKCSTKSAQTFIALLRHCANQLSLRFIELYTINRNSRHPLKTNCALLDDFELRYGVWLKLKDKTEINTKLVPAYSKENILFQTPQHLIIWQKGKEVFNKEISTPALLIEGLNFFFSYHPPWQQAPIGFKEKIKMHGNMLLALLEKERKSNLRFLKAFEHFTKQCQEVINLNLSINVVLDMLVQHVLTERIFRKVLNKPNFLTENIIACEIEKVIATLTSFNRDQFIEKLDQFYVAIETTAASIDDYAQKQDFLNVVYDTFFQCFAVKVADTRCIVSTPQPIVNFMVKSVEDILLH